MDTGKGKFVEVSKARSEELDEYYGKNKSPVFRIGEVVFIKNIQFKITGIASRGRLRLKLMEQQERN